MEKFVLGFMAGAAFFAVSISILPSYHSDARAVIQECEKSLPRDMKCKVIAVPKVKESK